MQLNGDVKIRQASKEERIEGLYKTIEGLHKYKSGLLYLDTKWEDKIKQADIRIAELKEKIKELEMS